MRNYKSKIVKVPEMTSIRAQMRRDGKKLVFTNGCFDIIHSGHVDYLAFAREQGDALIVGLNSDSSVRRSKGPQRPIVQEDDRAKVLASLESVDYVVIFDEDEPADLISKIVPDILVKGEDWAHYVSGRDIVEKNGGKVVLAKLVAGRSTTDIVKRIKESSK